jgi:outer membrane protein TolC
MAGRATELAVQQFSAQLLSTQSLRYKKQQEILETENSLDLLMGRFPEPIARAESLSDIRLPEVVNTGIPADLLLRRPDIQQAELELLASKLDLQAARAEFFPSLTLTPYMGLNDHSIPAALQFPGSLTVGLLGGVTSPILQQSRIRGGFNSSVAENKISLYNYQQTIIRGFSEVVTSLQRVENLKNLYALKEEETQVLLKAVSTANDLFRGGTPLIWK